MIREDSFYMAEALSQAREALAQGEIPIGAVVVDPRGRIIATGHNMTETLTDPTAHAEMLALTGATSSLGGKYLEGCTIFVTVEPCPMCAAALAWAQIDRIVWGADDPKRGFTLFSPSLLHPKTKTARGIMEQECGTLMKDFFKSRR